MSKQKYIVAVGDIEGSIDQYPQKAASELEAAIEVFCACLTRSGHREAEVGEVRKRMLACDTLDEVNEEADDYDLRLSVINHG